MCRLNYLSHVSLCHLNCLSHVSLLWKLFFFVFFSFSLPPNGYILQSWTFHHAHAPTYDRIPISFLLSFSRILNTSSDGRKYVGTPPLFCFSVTRAYLERHSLSHSRRKSETEECGKNAKEGVSVLSQKFQNYPAKACAQVMHTLVQWNIINKIHKLGLSHIIKKLSIKIKRNNVLMKWIFFKSEN